ncbi:MFS transporter [Saccharopolyspora phatthalungensis]|uniref:MFS family permease n=1 Tax=Saccharopolyspora phatthalungensis TaxID=664693 RepID=A0A840QG64_9PSEU|nr:MFS transporter [Saccharopolyspora phatthalungensis]MBB5159834.1 MFS family permease [Saccharopolyspora phatthalungensis]
MAASSPTNTPSEVTPVDRTQHADRRRAATSSFIGTTIEWYDYFIYGTAAALVFPKVFFGNLSGSVALLVSLVSFAVAFILRPVGGAVFGHFGDKLGRKRMLLITLIGMGICTGLIGLLPAQQTIGVAAPLLLLFLRMVQGFMLGGEWGGAALMTVEHAPTHRRGLYGSTMQAGAPAGLLLSAGAFAAVSALPREQFLAWGWRIPFLVSFALLGLGLYIRLRVTEPPVFRKLSEESRTATLPIKELLANEKRKILILAFLQTAANVGYFLITVYALTYVTEEVGMSPTLASLGLVVGAAVDLCLQPVFGWASDRFGRRRVYAFGCAFIGVYAFPFFLLLDSGNGALVILAFSLGLGIGHAATGSLHGTIFAEQFPTRYRYTGASVAYQISGVISSAPTPALAAVLVATFGSAQFVAWYVVLAAVISLICTLCLRETFRANL